MAVLGDTSITKLTLLNEIKTSKLHIPTTSNGSTLGAGSNGQVLKTNGTSVYWGSDNNTTYSVATTSANGLMSSTDKSKLDGMTPIYLGTEEASTTTPLNADTLEGHAASYFATANNLATKANASDLALVQGTVRNESPNNFFVAGKTTIYSTTTSGLTNAPVSSGYFSYLTWSQTSTYGVQLAISQNTVPKLFIRTYAGGVWKAWSQYGSMSYDSSTNTLNITM